MRKFLLWYRSIDVALQVVGIVWAVMFLSNDLRSHGGLNYFFGIFIPLIDNNIHGMYECKLTLVQLLSCIIGAFVGNRERMRAITFLLSLGCVIFIGFFFVWGGMFMPALFMLLFVQAVYFAFVVNDLVDIVRSKKPTIMRKRL